MNKLRCDSTWKFLTPDQKQTLEGWLFDQQLGYDELLRRVSEHFGITASKTSLCNYCQRLARERVEHGMNDAQAVAKTAEKSKLDVSTTTEAALKMVGQRLMESAVKPISAKELIALTKVLLVSQQQEIQFGWQELSRERFEFKASKAALKAAPLLKEMDQQDEERELARIEQIKYGLFGKQWDKIRRPAPLPAAGEQQTVQPNNATLANPETSAIQDNSA